MNNTGRVIFRRSTVRVPSECRQEQQFRSQSDRSLATIPSIRGRIVVSSAFPCPHGCAPNSEPNARNYNEKASLCCGVWMLRWRPVRRSKPSGTRSSVLLPHPRSIACRALHRDSSRKSQATTSMCPASIRNICVCFPCGRYATLPRKWDIGTSNNQTEMLLRSFFVPFACRVPATAQHEPEYRMRLFVYVHAQV